MKKIFAFSMILIISGNTYSQKGTPYFCKIDIGGQTSKTANSERETVLGLKVQGVYDWFFYQAMGDQPLKKNQNDLKFTLGTIGYGQKRTVSEEMSLVWGVGVTGILVPEPGSIEKHSDLYLGGSLYGHLSNEGHAFEVEVGGTYGAKPRNSNYDLNYRKGFVAFETSKGIRIVATLLALHLITIIWQLGLSAVGIRDVGLMIAMASVALHGADAYSADAARTQ